MPQFIYKAKQGPQKIIEGRVEAESLDGAINKILKMGFTPIDIHSHHGKSRVKTHKPLKSFSHFQRRPSSSEVTLFIRQVCDLIDAGVPMLRTLNIVVRQTRHPVLKDVFDKMYSFVKDGGTFSSALAQFPDLFPPLYVHMIKSGELAGNLDVVLNRLAEFCEKDLENRSQVKTSLMYPGLILTVGCIVIFILMTWVIPQITTIFEDMSEELPLPTKILIGASDIFSKFWLGILLMVSFVILYLKRLQNTLSGRLWWDGVKLKFPLLGKFISDVEIGHFARTLGTLLNSGVVIIPSLEAVEGIIQNEVLKQEIQRVSQEVKNGSSLASSLRGSTFFPEAASNMIAIGEEIGEPQKGLFKLADYFERRSQQTMKRFTALIEPILILFLALVVGFIVIAMLFPILKMNLIIG